MFQQHHSSSDHERMQAIQDADSSHGSQHAANTDVSEFEKSTMANGSNEDTAGEDTADESSKHELGDDSQKTAGQDEESQDDYLHGLPLFTVTACVTLVAFLTLLDTAIVATVSVEELDVTQREFS